MGDGDDLSADVVLERVRRGEHEAVADPDARANGLRLLAWREIIN